MSEHSKDKQTSHETPEEELLEAEEIELPETEEDLPEDVKPEDTKPLEEMTEEEKLTRALQESDERYLRLAAEYDNYRRRTSKEMCESYPRATCDVVNEFLPVLDNFERSLEFEAGSKEFTDGIKLIHKNFEEVLAALGVESFGEVGDSFDANIHDAVMHVEDPEFGENVVSLVLQKGYRMGDRIIRHAMVQTAN